MTANATLHYIYDPLCGWCYAAAPLVEAAQGVPGLSIALHAGGMMAGAQRQPVTPALRNYVMPHDRRIHALTGQPFGDAYFDGLLRDTTAVFDSEPPITAILAAGALGLAMLKRIQHAHYVEGRRIAQRAVLEELAAALGIAPEAFAAAYDACAGAVTARHIEASRRLLGSLGGRGFPTFALEEGGRFTLLEFGQYLGQPAAWQATLAQRVPTPAAGKGEGEDQDVPACGPDGCVL